MKIAVLVIDLLEDFFRNNILANNRSKLTKSINEVVDNAHKKNIPVIWITQEYNSDLSDAPLYNRKNNKAITIKGTKGCKILHELNYKENDYKIVKKRYSSFYQTDLDETLNELKIDTLIIAGINTMTCVRTTAIDAYQRDYEVILALDCIDSYDIEQHNNSIKYLQYAVATAKYNDEIIGIIESQKY